MADSPNTFAIEMTLVDRMASAVDRIDQRLNQHFERQERNNQRAASSWHRVESAMKLVESRATAMGRSLTGMFDRLISRTIQWGSVLTGIAGAGGAIVGLRRLLAMGIELNTAFERYNMTLRTVMGSQSRASDLMRFIEKFAERTPFNVPQLTQASVQLESIGLSAKKWLPVIGDLAAAFGGSADSVNMLIRAFSFMKAGAPGEAFETLRRFGIGGLDFQRRGVSLKTARENPDQALEVTRQIINERFGGLMDQLTQTLTGRASNLQDVFMRVLRKATKGGFEQISLMAQDALNFFDKMESSGGLTRLSESISGVMGRIGAGLREVLNQSLAEGQRGDSLGDILVRRMSEAWEKLKDPATKWVEWFASTMAKALLGVLGSAAGSVASNPTGPLAQGLALYGGLRYGPKIIGAGARGAGRWLWGGAAAAAAGAASAAAPAASTGIGAGQAAAMSGLGTAAAYNTTLASGGAGTLARFGAWGLVAALAAYTGKTVYDNHYSTASVGGRMQGTNEGWRRLAAIRRQAPDTIADFIGSGGGGMLDSGMGASQSYAGAIDLIRQSTSRSAPTIDYDVPSLMAKLKTSTTDKLWATTNARQGMASNYDFGNRMMYMAGMGENNPEDKARALQTALEKQYELVRKISETDKEIVLLRHAQGMEVIKQNDELDKQRSGALEKAGTDRGSARSLNRLIMRLSGASKDHYSGFTILQQLRDKDVAAVQNNPFLMRAFGIDDADIQERGLSRLSPEARDIMGRAMGGRGEHDRLYAQTRAGLESLEPNAQGMQERARALAAQTAQVMIDELRKAGMEAAMAAIAGSAAREFKQLANDTKIDVRLDANGLRSALAKLNINVAIDSPDFQQKLRDRLSEILTILLKDAKVSAQIAAANANRSDAADMTAGLSNN